jgi:acetyl esterase/lipase
MLQYYADNASLIVLSIGYRLAPEHPYPAGNEDCFDIGTYLVDHAQRDFGVPLLFMGGDSAGAHLSTLTCFKLLEVRPDFAFRGLVLSYGVYNIAAALPQVHNFDMPLVLTKDIMRTYATTNDSLLWHLTCIMPKLIFSLVTSTPTSRTRRPSRDVIRGSRHSMRISAR